MIHIAETDYNKVLQMRRDVMYPNNTIDDVKLDDDDMGIHLGVYDDGQLTCVASIFIDKDRNLQFRKLATSTNLQGKGYGSAMMKWLIDYVNEMKLNSLWCNARKEALGFYKKFGFEETGETFERDGYQFCIVRYTK